MVFEVVCTVAWFWSGVVFTNRRTCIGQLRFAGSLHGAVDGVLVMVLSRPQWWLLPKPRVRSSVAIRRLLAPVERGA